MSLHVQCHRVALDAGHHHENRVRAGRKTRGDLDVDLIHAGIQRSRAGERYARRPASDSRLGLHAASRRRGGRKRARLHRALQQSQPGGVDRHEFPGSRRTRGGYELEIGGVHDHPRSVAAAVYAEYSGRDGRITTV